MFPSIINRKSRVERMARLIDDIICENHNESECLTPAEIDTTVRILALDDLDRIAAALERIADSKRRR